MAASNVITANVVVQFGDNVSAFVEVDSRTDGFNHGKTSFAPGEDAYLLLFMPAGYEVKYVEPTAGLLAKVADDVKDVSDIIQFANVDSNTTQYPISTIATGSNVPASWLGNDLGDITKRSDHLLVLPERGRDPVSGKPVPEYRIGIATVEYGANCEVWKLSGVPVAVTQVMCYWVVGKI